jgi:hypothetical protein
MLPKGNLAIFGYRPAMKVKIYSKSFYILCTCLKEFVETWRILKRAYELDRKFAQNKNKNAGAL